MKSTTFKGSYALALVLAIVIVRARAQTKVAEQASSMPVSTDKPVPMCDLDAIDSTFAFRDEPTGEQTTEQTVFLYLLNKGNTACRLKGRPLASFAVDGHSMFVEGSDVGLGGVPLPPWDPQAKFEVVLPPGAATAIDLNWASTGPSCQWADWADISFNWAENNNVSEYPHFHFIPSDWPMRICSPLRSSGYRTRAGVPSGGAQKDPPLRVSLLQEKIYSDERATLRVALAMPPPSNENAIGCASLYAVTHPTPSTTYLERLRTVGSHRVDSYTPEQIREDKQRPWPPWKKDFRRDCDIAAGTLSADAEVQARDLATLTGIEWRTAVPGKEPAFFTAPTHFTVLDVDNLAPDWGETVQGIRAGLSVDRVRFSVGERVPLHVRWEALNPAVPLAEGECNEPKPDLEIQNSDHQVLKTLSIGFCSGHGFGPFKMPEGTTHDEFWQVSTVSPPSYPFDFILPGPGIYYLVSVWSPNVLDKSETASKGVAQFAAGRWGKVYATARSLPMRIEVVPSTNP